MAKVIAIVRLAPGHVAFYDELTSMHLTIGNPMGEVLDYMNTSIIRRAVQNKVLSLVTGSFNIENPEPEKKVELKVEPKQVKEAVDKIVETVKPEEIKEEVPAIEEVAETEETVTEEVTETEIEIEKPKSKRKKKEEQ